jgi:3-mercaptopyruvate sulfurtransferase SseA
VAKVLVNHGFKLVRPLFGGLDAWVAAGYAVESSPVERLVEAVAGQEELPRAAGAQAQAPAAGRPAVETDP